MKKAVSLLLASAATAVAVEWSEKKGLNCWDGYGAEEIDTYPIGRLSIANCQAKCVETPDCTAVTVQMNTDDVNSDTGNCWRRKNLQLAKCQTGTNYDTWIQRNQPAPPPPAPAPHLPAAGFPTTQPQFMKAFIEGLLSDDGTDMKKCEGDASQFKSAVVDLVQSAVGATKAVAAAVEEAKQTCTVVAGEAKKLAFNLFQDAFHPQRIAQNFDATRTDVLESFGEALVMLAKKDFRNAGDKVGMATRRIVEGAQESNPNSWQPIESAYTKMGEMNCYDGHGATDLEKVAGESCGKMTVEQCQKKCDEVAECQGITVSHWLPEASQGLVLCYRRGSIQVDQCDHQSDGYDTFVNPAVQMTSDSSAVASVAVFAVTHWSAAMVSQSDMASATATMGGDFLEGVLEGLMSDGSDFSDCVAKISAVREALTVAKEHVGKSLAAAIAAAKVAKQDCGVVAKEAEKLGLAAFNDIKHPDQVVQNFKDTQYDFLMELGKAFEALAGNDYTSAGTLMGMAMRRAFEGKQAGTVFTGTAMPVTVTMTQVSHIGKLVCEVAEQKWIEDKATNLICAAITKRMPISNCQATLEKLWDKITARCPKGRATVIV